MENELIDRLCVALFFVVLAYGNLAAAQSTQDDTSRDVSSGALPKHIDKVEITAKRITDTDERKASTVAKIVIGHDEIMRFGDTEIGDVLKRLPGVTLGGTPGRSGGGIRMRGLGSGYTQIMINGEPAPRGFELDSISPELIERIEIIRTPLAEYGAQAIAGTLNIVLREVPPKRNAQFTITSNVEDNQHLETRIAIEDSGKIDNMSYLLAGTIKNMGQWEASSHAISSTMDPAGHLLDQQYSSNKQYRDGYNGNIAPRLNWRFADDDTASVQLFYMFRHAHDTYSDHIDQPVGVAPYVDQIGDVHSRFNVYKFSANRQVPLSDQGKWEGRLSLSDYSSSSNAQYVQSNPDSKRTLESDTRTHSGGGNTAGKWTIPVGDSQKLVFGYEGDWSVVRSDLFQSGYVAGSPLGSDTSASVLRTAGFGQDEWNISKNWSVYAGLRWEEIATHSRAMGDHVANTSAVLSPSLQSAWRFREGGADRLRLSLSRSYKAPDTISLLPRVQLATANDAFHPDTEGNPQLKPELAWGLELAFEHYLPDGGLLSANAFNRQVTDVVRSLTTLGVDGRWISQPVNLDHASVYGIELEAKMRLAEVMDHAPPLDLRANLSRYWSNVTGIPGPYNRLGAQTPASANLGADYRFASVPLTIGANVNWVPSVTTQLSATQQSYSVSKTGIDFYALWKISSSAQFRFSGGNLLHENFITNATNASDGNTIQLRSVARSWINWVASLVIKY